MDCTKHGIMMIAACLTLAACSSEAKEADDASANGASASPALTEANNGDNVSVGASPVSAEVKLDEKAGPADWSGINDAEVRSQIDSSLAKFEKSGEKFGLVIVSSLDGDDPFSAAGEAAWDLGTPAIVVATKDKDIQFVGDEALAYFADDRARMKRETAAFFDRGEFVEGIDHALAEIKAFWSDPG